MGRPSKKAITEKKDLLISYHLQGYSVAEMALQLKITEEKVVEYLTETVDKAVAIEITAKKQARQVELLRVNYLMKKLTDEFNNAVDHETDSGALARDSVKATVSIVTAMTKLIDMKSKLLGLYSIEDIIGKQNPNRLLALDYENVSDQELALMYASALNKAKTK